MGAPRAVAARAVKSAAVVADRLRPPPPGVVVLLYHRVGGGTGVAVDLPLGLFAEQVAELAGRDRAVTLDAALERLAGPPPTGGSGPQDPPVVVTFDDGTVDVVELALPVLVEHRVPAVVYLATDHVERGVDFPGGGRPLSWAAVRDAVSTGLVTIGSHTHTHALLDRLDPAAAAVELDRSRELIADRVGVVADHFAYPKAVPASGAVEPLVRARFRSAALGGCRPNPYGRTDAHRLARSALQRSDGMVFFRHKAAGGMALEDRARRVLNRRRYAAATR